ncbi:MAG: efflux RND transporter periplasmic adaptor subunit [Planctomycetota bacterium]
MILPGLSRLSRPSPTARAARPAATRRGGVALWAIAGLVLVAGAAGAIALASGGGASSADGPITGDLGAAEVRTFDITTVANGELEARNQIEIRSQLEQRSTITYIVDEGQRVNEGDLLVQLNTDAIETKIEEELLRVESSRNEVAAAETSYRIQISTNDSALRKAELNLELKRLALQQWQEGDVTKRRQQLQLAVEQAERQLKRLDEKFERSEKLLSQGFLSKNERDIDEINYVEAVAKLESTKLDQEIYDKFQYPRDERSKLSDVEEAEANLARVIEENEINLKNKKSNLETKRRQLTLREQKLEKYRSQKMAATIAAPSDGLVVYASSLDQGRRWGGNDGPLQIGQQVNTNELLIALPDTTDMIAAVRVHESLAGRVQPGQPVDVKIEAAGGGMIRGEVESIGVLAETGGWRDPNRREYTVRVALNDAEANLKPSMRCEGVIRLGRVEAALAVPVQAVYSDGAVRFVYTPAEGKFRRVPVQVGRRSAAYAEILAGVEKGATVLLREPDPAEVLAQPYEDTELAMVGLVRDEGGRIRPDRPAGSRGGPPAIAQSPGAPASSPPAPAKEATAEIADNPTSSERLASTGESTDAEANSPTDSVVTDEDQTADETAATPTLPAAN